MARMIADETLALLDTDDKYALGPLSVERVSVASPIGIGIVGSSPAIALFWFFARRFVCVRKEWKEGDVIGSQAEIGKASATAVKADAVKKVAEAHLTDAQAEYVQEVTRTRRLYNDQMEKGGRTSADEVVSVVATVLREIVGPNAQFLEDLGSNGIERINELLQNQGKPAFERLADENRNILAIESSTDFEALLPTEEDPEQNH